MVNGVASEDIVGVDNAVVGDNKGGGAVVYLSGFGLNTGSIDGARQNHAKESVAGGCCVVEGGRAIDGILHGHGAESAGIASNIRAANVDEDQSGVAFNNVG